MHGKGSVDGPKGVATTCNWSCEHCRATRMLVVRNLSRQPLAASSTSATAQPRWQASQQCVSWNRDCCIRGPDGACGCAQAWRPARQATMAAAATRRGADMLGLQDSLPVQNIIDAEGSGEA